MKKNRGFTIVESLVAIAVLILVIAAPLTLAQRSLASADSAREQVTAAYLAQEAIEFVRNTRDTNAIAGDEWLAGLESCASGSVCSVDPTNEVAAQQVAACGPLNDDCTLWQHRGAPPFQNLSKLFGHPQNRVSEDLSQWERSIFRRKVSIVESSDNREAKVLVRMDWMGGGFGERSLEVSTNLMRWYVH